MAVQEQHIMHLGYHATNFFAVSSRCGTPDELKYLIDTAHSYGVAVLMDIVHSHASSNATDGINMFDGTNGISNAVRWVSLDVGLALFQLWQLGSIALPALNLRYWMEEFKFDGFRFDGVTSMMYSHHGLQMAFTGDTVSISRMSTDVDAMVYLMLANVLHTLCWELKPPSLKMFRACQPSLDP